MKSSKMPTTNVSAQRRIIVIGGVAAGMSAASQARRREPGADVIVFERGPYISYGACGMPYNVMDPQRRIDDLVVLTPERAINDRGIDLRVRHEVIELDLQSQRVTVKNLETGAVTDEPFDALVLATGASAIRLPLPGIDLPGVVVLRELTDGGHLKKLLASKPKRAIVLGGGFIAMEMCHALTERGLTVRVLEKLPHILSGWSEETVKLVLEELGRHGVEVHTGVEVTGAEAGPGGRVAAVVTQQGSYPADFVLQAVGIRPNTMLAADAGLRIGETGAIWVNQFQQTSHPAVWAAGDCAEAYHRLLRKNAWIPLGTTANKQGRIAGANAVGLHQRFAGIVGTSGFRVFDLELARTGLSANQAEAEGFEPATVTVRQSSRAHSYPGSSPIQVTLVADIPSGILLGGEIAGREGAALRINILAAALASHMTVSDLQGLDLVYAPPFAPVWDPILVAANQLIKKVRTQEIRP